MSDSPPTPPAEDPRAALVRLGRLAEELAAERQARRLLELRVAELERRLGQDSTP
ncbi:hypothetical protein [Frankia sp. CiP3]|uniref:hypothetical protein n=1 Tax=Frankia sp. CiP3 TaxID=2880971 RepID=UPI001EF63BAF|nr:hypothetical protein [Frankia sp. CiP3]